MAIGVRTFGSEDGGVTSDYCDAVTIAGISYRAGFSFVFGGDGEFDAEVVMIKRPNLELAGWRCLGAVAPGDRDTRVIGGPDRDN